MRSCRSGYFRDRAEINIFYWEITAKRVTPLSFLSLISLVNNNILAEKAKLGIIDACVRINI